MSVVKRFEHWTVQIEDEETPEEIIKALSELPKGVKIDLSQTNFQRLWIRFETYEKT